MNAFQLDLPCFVSRSKEMNLHKSQLSLLMIEGYFAVTSYSTEKGKIYIDAL